MLPRLLALALAGSAFSAVAQLAPDNPDWKELDAPPPPALRTQGLIPVEVPGGASRRSTSGSSKQSTTAIP